MKAHIYTPDGHFASARTSLSIYIKAKGKKFDKVAEELDVEITEGERLKKSDKEWKAQLWNACIETASEALKVASHSVEIRDCQLVRNLLWQLGMWKIVLEI
jgi:DnaJ homolog subfamily C member 3